MATPSSSARTIPLCSWRSVTTEITAEQLHPVSRFELRQSSTAPTGTYLFLLFAVHIEAGAKRKRMDTIFVRLPDDSGSFSVLDERACSLLLGELIRDARTAPRREHSGLPNLEDALDHGYDAFEVRVAEIRQRTEDRNRAVVQTRGWQALRRGTGPT